MASNVPHGRSTYYTDLPRITIDARDDGRLAVGAGGLWLALGGGVGVQGSARPEVSSVGDEGHAARDDELGRDEAVDEHAQHEDEPDLVERGRVPDEQRAEGQRHDDSRGADGAARVLEGVDDGLL
eukprot:scaffold9275_cov75-Phaeocystis_antarctica.AAC.1